MKTDLRKSLLLAAALALPMIAGACAHEVSHSETDKPGKHEETTVYRNPDGSTSVEHEKSTHNP